LNKYTTILRCKDFKFYYIDAFAGAGRAKLRTYQKQERADDHTLIKFDEISSDQEEYIDGSPRRALQLKYPFQGYLFIDSSNAHAEKLVTLKEEFPDRNIRIRVGDSNDILLDRVVNNPRINWRNSRAVVFLDPFGMQVAWKTIEALASTKAIEVIINNPIHMGIQRFLERRGAIPADRREALNKYFGCPDWEDIVYPENNSLFGLERTKVKDASDQLGKFYNKRLKDIFGYAASVRQVRNTKGSPLYYLHWAGPNATGRKIADYVLAQGETI